MKNSKKNITEKDRWLIVATICSAIGTAITTYISGKK